MYVTDHSYNQCAMSLRHCQPKEGKPKCLTDDTVQFLCVYIHKHTCVCEKSHHPFYLQ